MRLITSLTSLTAATLCASLLAGCGGNSPRRPESSDSKRAANTSFYDDCYEARSRGVYPVGCPQDPAYYRRGPRPTPSIQQEPLTLPELPTRGVLGGR